MDYEYEEYDDCYEYDDYLDEEEKFERMIEKKGKESEERYYEYLRIKERDDARQEYDSSYDYFDYGRIDYIN